MDKRRNKGYAIAVIVMMAWLLCACQDSSLEGTDERQEQSAAENVQEVTQVENAQAVSAEERTVEESAEDKATNNEEVETFEMDDHQKMETVKNAVLKLIQNDFQEKALDEKRRLVEELLNDFVNKGYIKEGSVKFDEKSETISYVYNVDGEIKSVVELTDGDPDQK